jgi:hypothetical protein
MLTAMSLDVDGQGGREERRRMLAAVATVSADPVRLVDVVQDAADDADAARRIAEAFGLDLDLAAVALDLQVRRLTPSTRARIAEELRVLEAPWGPALDADLLFTTRRSATLTVDGIQRSFRGGGPNAVRDQVFAFLHEQVTGPQLRPVVIAETGAADAARWVVRPDRSASREQP